MRRLIILFLLAAATLAGTATAADNPPEVVGMYIHQHWPYKNPYAARTWTADDYRAYCGGLKQLGYNTVMIWPILETMPSPLTPSDQANLSKIQQVIDMLHGELGMRVYITLCPNVGAKNEEAAKATFEARHFFYCDTRVNPADPAALDRLVQWRANLFRPLAAADGVVIIDSDPGGYPGSSNDDFVRLLMAHRKMFDSLRPGIELVYWNHIGWPAYGRWYQTGVFNRGTEAEFVEALTKLKELDPQPWSIANGLPYAEKTGLASKVVSYNYGSIEGEPTLPMTRFDYQGAWAAGHNKGPRGVMGNAQTHCVQLPNTFAFARGAAGQPVTRADMVQFANDLIPNHGEEIVRGWEALDAGDPAAMRAMATTLETTAKEHPPGGRLKGLLFNDPDRFLTDLVCMLRFKIAFAEFAATAPASANLKPALRAFTDALNAWYERTGYQNVWDWPHLAESLGRLHSLRIDRLVKRDILNPVAERGATPFEKIANTMRDSETFTPDLIRSLNESLKENQ